MKELMKRYAVTIVEGNSKTMINIFDKFDEAEDISLNELGIGLNSNFTQTEDDIVNCTSCCGIESVSRFADANCNIGATKKSILDYTLF